VLKVAVRGGEKHRSTARHEFCLALHDYCDEAKSVDYFFFRQLLRSMTLQAATLKK